MVSFANSPLGLLFFSMGLSCFGLSCQDCGLSAYSGPSPICLFFSNHRRSILSLPAITTSFLFLTLALQGFEHMKNLARMPHSDFQRVGLCTSGARVAKLSYYGLSGSSAQIGGGRVASCTWRVRISILMIQVWYHSKFCDAVGLMPISVALCAPIPLFFREPIPLFFHWDRVASILAIGCWDSYGNTDLIYFQI